MTSRRHGNSARICSVLSLPPIRPPTSAVTSHHWEILLRSLAARTADSGTAGLNAGLLRAADAAGRARNSWLNLARAFNQIDTDTMRHLAPTSGEAGDLALCARRLAYADAAWTLASGPGHQPRPPQDFCPAPQRCPAGAGRCPPRL
jgi:hypothetical protein